MEKDGKNRANFHIGSSYISNQKGHWFIIDPHSVLLNFWAVLSQGFFDAINLGILHLGKMGFVASKNEREPDTLIKSLKFNEYRDFFMSTMRCHINAYRGRYAVEDNYREIFQA